MIFTKEKKLIRYKSKCLVKWPGFLVCLFFCVNVSAQSPEELVSRLKTSPGDSSRAGLYTRISNTILNSNASQALQYGKEGLAFAQAKDLDDYLPGLYYAIGNAYNALGNDDSALIFLNHCSAAARKAGKLELEVNSLRTAGYILVNLSKYDEASEKLFYGLRISEAAKDEALAASVYSTISMLYLYQSNYDKALSYGEKALDYFRRTGNDQKLGSIYLNVGLIYAEIKNFNKAADYYKNALAAYEKTGNKIGMATTYGNMSTIEVKDRPKKIAYLLKAKDIWDVVSPEHPNAVGNTGNLGMAYRSLAMDPVYAEEKQKGNITESKAELLQKAEKYLAYAVQMCRKLDFGRDLAYFTLELAELKEQQGDFKTANKYLHEYLVLNDSLYSQENKNKIAEAESKYVINHKNSEIAISKLTIANNQKVRIGLIAGLALLGVIGVLLYYQVRNSKRTNARLVALNSKLDDANKTKATFFAILSHDLRSPVANLVNFLQLQKRSPGLLDEKQVADRETKIGTAAESLLETMETMLLWSKGQMEKFVPQINEVPVDGLFEYLQKFFSGTQKVNFIYYGAEGLHVTSDENYLQTIMQNLTSNAVKALANTASPMVEWTVLEQDGKIVLRLTDNGPGVDADLLKDDGLFHPNNRTGLGMHLVRDLASAIRCRITAENRPEGGMRFYLYL